MSTISAFRTLSQLEESLTSALTQIPGVSVARVSATRIERYQPDLVLHVQRGEEHHIVVVEYKARAGADAVAHGAAQLRRYEDVLTDLGATYLVVGVPHLSNVALDHAKALGVGAIDVAGNCYLSFDGVHLEVRGRKNAGYEPPSIRHFFSPKSSRLSRVVLSDVHRWWRVHEIAEQAGIDAGLVSRLKTQMVAEGLLAEQGKAVRAARPEDLVNTWLANYSFKRNRSHEFYSTRSAHEIEESIIALSTERGIPASLALFSGANHIAPHVRIEKAYAYVGSHISAIAESLELRPAVSGANVTLIEPYDAGVFMYNQRVHNVSIVSDLQLYLDLKSFKASRSDEAAEYLYHHRLEKEWKRL